MIYYFVIIMLQTYFRQLPVDVNTLLNTVNDLLNLNFSPYQA